MPPPIPDIPQPTDRARSALNWLEAHSIVPNERCPIRSSMAGMALSDPFQFYLSHRLDLVPALRYSEALSRGSWFHTCVEAFLKDPGTAELFFNEKMASRRQELNTICDQVGIQPTSRQPILDRETHDANTARSWFFAAAALPVPGLTGHPNPATGHVGETFLDYIQRPYWSIPQLNGHAATELTIGLWENGHLLVAKPDLLLHHRDQNTLWLVDFKTTGLLPRVRAQSCPFDFQTRHYLYIVHQRLRERFLQERLNLPANVRLGGMIHWIVQKPPLKFGSTDRPYRMVDVTPTRGPNRGITRQEKEFTGEEPSTDNYVRRIHSWYSATGEYTHEAQERLTNPPIDLSFTYWRPESDGSVDRELLSEYNWVKDRITQFAGCAPFPCLFPRTGQSLVPRFDEENPYAPLHFAEPRDWPTLIQTAKLLVHRRDPRLHEARSHTLLEN